MWGKLFHYYSCLPALGSVLHHSCSIHGPHQQRVDCSFTNRPKNILRTFIMGSFFCRCTYVPANELSVAFVGRPGRPDHRPSLLRPPQVLPFFLQRHHFQRVWAGHRHFHPLRPGLLRPYALLDHAPPLPRVGPANAHDGDGAVFVRGISRTVGRSRQGALEADSLVSVAGLGVPGGAEAVAPGVVPAWRSPAAQVPRGARAACQVHLYRNGAFGEKSA